MTKRFVVLNGSNQFNFATRRKVEVSSILTLPRTIGLLFLMCLKATKMCAPVSTFPNMFKIWIIGLLTTTTMTCWHIMSPTAQRISGIQRLLPPETIGIPEMCMIITKQMKWPRQRSNISHLVQIPTPPTSKLAAMLPMSPPPKVRKRLRQKIRWVWMLILINGFKSSPTNLQSCRQIKVTFVKNKLPTLLISLIHSAEARLSGFHHKN